MLSKTKLYYNTVPQIRLGRKAHQIEGNNVQIPSQPMQTHSPKESFTPHVCPSDRESRVYSDAESQPD